MAEMMEDGSELAAKDNTIFHVFFLSGNREFESFCCEYNGKKLKDSKRSLIIFTTNFLLSSGGTNHKYTSSYIN